MMRTILNAPRLLGYSALITSCLAATTPASAEPDSEPVRGASRRDSSGSGPAQANIDLSPFALDQWTPPRITARTSHKGPDPPEPNLNMCYGFSGIKLSSPPSKTKPHETSVWIAAEEPCTAKQHGYTACYSSLKLGTVFPVLGSMYRFDARPGAVSATRLPAEDIPPGIQLRRDTYVFPLLSSRPYKTWNSGRLHDCMILVGHIGMKDDDPAKPFAKLVITASPTDESGEVWKDMSQINWQVVHVGDVLDFKGKQHRVAHIVPPNDRGFEIHGRTCPMIGWIALETKLFESAP